MRAGNRQGIFNPRAHGVDRGLPSPRAHRSFRESERCTVARGGAEDAETTPAPPPRPPRLRVNPSLPSASPKQHARLCFPVQGQARLNPRTPVRSDGPKGPCEHIPQRRPGASRIKRLAGASEFPGVRTLHGCTRRRGGRGVHASSLSASSAPPREPISPFGQPEAACPPMLPGTGPSPAQSTNASSFGRPQGAM